MPNQFNDGVPFGDSHDPNILMMYSQGMDMSSDEMLGTCVGQTSEGRNTSNGNKRKQGGQYYEMMEVLRNAMEFANDQLK